MIKQVQSEQTKTKTTLPKLELLRDPRTLTILEFIKSNEDVKTGGGVTMEKVAKDMNEKGICSRPTTLNLVFSLLREGILLENKRRNKYFHDLVVNKNYHFDVLLSEIFKGHVEEIRESLKPFETLMDEKFDIESKVDEKKLSLSVSFEKDKINPRLRPEPRETKDGRSSHY